MAHIIVVGAGVGGVPCAYELRKKLGKSHRVTLVGSSPYFEFTPSNPWIAVGWRKCEKTRIEMRAPLDDKGIQWHDEPAEVIDATKNSLRLRSGLELAFEEVPGLGPAGFTHSVCTHEHALSTWEKCQEFLKSPGPIVVRAAAGPSCFGPAYEFAMILDADLRRRKLRDQVPMTFVTSESYIGHMGLGGVGDGKGLMESELRQRHIKLLVSSKVASITAGEMKVIEHEDEGKPKKEHALPFKYAMMIPAFALPEIPPRNVTWAKIGKWAHPAKIAFEKYFLRKVRTGSTTPVYEKYVLKLLGIGALKAKKAA